MGGVRPSPLSNKYLLNCSSDVETTSSPEISVVDPLNKKRAA
ncbi:uncharacterized protein G2W53_034368 [Senna tora]|uniref:Uncharacterized protein n=1 Tax=Senna tora TaxID=362788 RepID=A0A834T3Z5_9FABA|nr:uncharacterized protein G2W53_034368 [Senna tora]